MGRAPGDRGPFCVRLLDHEPPRPIGPPRTGVCNPDPRSRADDERRAGTEFEAEAPGRVEKVDAILSPPDIEGRREVAGTDGEPVIRAAPLPPAAPTPGAMVN
jgi:hypothetical protein